MYIYIYHIVINGYIKILFYITSNLIHKGNEIYVYILSNIEIWILVLQ